MARITIVKHNSNEPYAIIADDEKAQAAALKRAQEAHAKAGYSGKLSMKRFDKPYDHFKLVSDKPDETPKPPEFFWHITTTPGCTFRSEKAYQNLGACRSGADGAIQMISGVTGVRLTGPGTSQEFTIGKSDRKGLAKSLVAVEKPAEKKPAETAKTS